MIYTPLNRKNPLNYNTEAQHENSMRRGIIYVNQFSYILLYLSMIQEPSVIPAQNSNRKWVNQSLSVCSVIDTFMAAPPLLYQLRSQYRVDGYRFHLSPTCFLVNTQHAAGRRQSADDRANQQISQQFHKNFKIIELEYHICNHHVKCIEISTNMRQVQ